MEKIECEQLNDGSVCNLVRMHNTDTFAVRCIESKHVPWIRRHPTGADRTRALLVWIGGRCRRGRRQGIGGIHHDGCGVATQSRKQGWIRRRSTGRTTRGSGGTARWRIGRCGSSWRRKRTWFACCRTILVAVVVVGLKGIHHHGASSSGGGPIITHGSRRGWIQDGGRIRRRSG